jgi:hypothetical protein
MFRASPKPFGAGAASMEAPSPRMRPMSTLLLAGLLSAASVHTVHLPWPQSPGQQVALL